MLRSKAYLERRKPLDWTFVTPDNILIPAAPDKESADSAGPSQHNKPIDSSAEPPTGATRSEHSDSSESPSPDLRPFSILFDSIEGENISLNLDQARVLPIRPNKNSFKMAEATTYTAGFFHGKDNEDAEVFFQNLTSYCSLKEVDILKIIPLALKDGARVWFVNLSDDDKKDADTLRANFLQRYGPPDITNFSKVTEIFSMKQGSNEKARDFISKITNLCSKAKLSDDMTCKAILQGLHPTIQAYVLAKDAKTLAEIDKQAIMAELINPKAKEPSIHAAVVALREEIQQIRT